MKYFLILFCRSALLFSALMLFGSGNDAHADQPAVPAAQTGAALQSLSGRGENFEVILKFSSFKPGDDVSLIAYILDSTTNEPVQGAALAGDLSNGTESLPVAFTEMSRNLPGAYSGKVRIVSGKPYSWLFDISLGERSDLVAIDGFKAGAENKGISRPAPSQAPATGYEIKLTPAKIVILLAVFVGVQVAIAYFLRKRYPVPPSAKDPQ